MKLLFSQKRKGGSTNLEIINHFDIEQAIALKFAKQSSEINGSLINLLEVVCLTLMMLKQEDFLKKLMNII